MNIQKLKQQFDELWTQNDVDYAFNVATMTVWNWRAKRGFPESVQFHGKAARFIPEQIRSWAKAHGYRIREPKRQPGRRVAA